ncbi:MAG: hypothetical protein AAFR01_10440 [Pseudomonadota bacterium]
MKGLAETMDYAGISTLVSQGMISLASANEVGKSLINVVKSGRVDKGEVSSQVLSLYTHILEAQQSYVALKQAVAEMEQYEKERDAFEQEMARYALREVAPGVMIPTLKNTDDSDEPSHSICPNCKAERVKAVLQRVGPGLKCLRCELYVRTDRNDGPSTYGSPGRRKLFE